MKTGYILVTVGLFIAALAGKVRQFNLYFLLTGVILAGIGFYIINFLNKKEEKETTEEYEHWKNDLIKNGIKKEVHFNDCQFMGNDYREEVIKDGYSKREQYDGLQAAMTGKDIREFKEVKQQQLRFKTEVNGIMTTFYSPIIPKDEITLQFILSDKKKTYLYIDRHNTKNYFFDMEFLED